MYLFVGLKHQVMPHFHGIVSLQAIIRDVIGNEVEESFFVNIRAVFDVILLRSNHGQILLFFTPIFAKFHTTHILLVNQIGSNTVFRGIVPRT